MPPTRTLPLKLRHWLPALVILMLALALRLRGLETTGLWGDQAFTLNTAMRWVNGGAMPLAANKSSVGFVNPPMIEYLYAAALAVWPDILSVSLLTLLGGLVAVAVTGAVTARLFGRRAGLWAMLAHAVAPWAVFWSQLIWNQTMVPPFAALALGGLLLYLAPRPRGDQPRALYLIGAFAAAAAMTQVHPGSAVQVGTMGLALLLFRRRVRWSHVAAAAAVFVALYIPYILYQFGVGWGDFQAMGGVAGQESSFSVAAVLLSLDLIRSQGLYRAVPGVVRWDYLAVFVFVAALALTVWRWWRPATGDEPPTAAGRARRFFVSRISYFVSPAAISDQPPERVALTVILLWFLMPLLFYLRSSVYLQNYYLVGQWPAHFMILGIGLDTAHRATGRLAGRTAAPRSRRLWTAAGWALPVLFLASAAFQIHFSLRYQDARAAGDGPDMQVRHARAMIATSRELLAADAGSRLVGVGRGHQVENSNLALLVEFVDPARVLLADGDLALPRPAADAYYLDTRPGSAASETLVARAEPLPDDAIPVKEQLWRFYRWPQGEPDAADSAEAWTMGLALAGHTREQLTPGQPLWVELAWRVAERPPNVPYHFGVYLLDEHDNVVAQHDGPGFDSIQWRPGDGFITYHLLPIPDDLPPGRYRLAAALYSWPELGRAELVSGGNTAYLEEIDVGE